MTSNSIDDHALRVSGIRIHSLPHETVLSEMDANISGHREIRYISITNTESMYHARRTPFQFDYIENAALSLCDGVGVVIGGWFQGRDIRRFTGPMLVEEACRYGISRGWRHFFCGGREGVALQLSTKLTRRFPGLITAGTFCPPFRTLKRREEAEMIRHINQSKPDILWVGLGLPKQEKWIERYRHRINVPWMIGVGAAFDFHAGTARWAPKWIRQAGLEWLYRLCFEPRMLKRNYWSYQFLFHAMLRGLCTLPRRKIRGQ